MHRHSCQGAHRSAAGGPDGDTRDVAEGRLRECDRRRPAGGVLRDRELVRRASASELAREQAAKQVVGNVQRPARHACSSRANAGWRQ